MRETITEKSLYKAFEYCGFAKLPEVWDGGSIWIDALAKVVKRNGEESFALAKRMKGGTYRLIKDFGSTESIYKVKEYYPYNYLKQGFMPVVNTKEECIAVLTLDKGMNADNLRNKSFDELFVMVVDMAVEHQIADSNINDTHYEEEISRDAVSDMENGIYNNYNYNYKGKNGKKGRTKKEV